MVPWLAIAFGCGILLYFSIDQEPAPWAAILLFTGAAAVSVSVRLRPVGFPLALFIAAVAFGFASATIKRTLIAHPVLWTPAWNVDVAGFVEVREERERSDRLTVRVERMEASRLDEKPERVRVSVCKGTMPKLRRSTCSSLSVSRMPPSFQYGQLIDSALPDRCSAATRAAR